MRLQPSSLLQFLAFTAIVVGCSAAKLNDDEGNALGDASTEGSPGGPGGGLTGTGCNPACGSGQFCSIAGRCIAAGTCAADGDCTAGMSCDAASGKCAPGGDCGSEEVVAAPIASNLLMVIDRSCSMTRLIGTQLKWQIAVDALKKLVEAYKGKIQFGLTLFPDSDEDKCNQGAIPLTLAPANEDKISSMLTSSLVTTDPTYPSGPCVTNIDTAVKQAGTDPGLKDPSRKSYLMLVTDGAQAKCASAGGAAGAVTIVGDLYKAGIPTYVVGFGSSSDLVALNDLALAGGVPSTADPATKYYKAEDATGLSKALETIGAKTLGCTYHLAKAPPDPSKVFVFFDKTDVPRDPGHTDGWDYDPATNAIQFYGSRCAALEAGKVTSVQVVFGCRRLPS